MREKSSEVSGETWLTLPQTVRVDRDLVEGIARLAREGDRTVAAEIRRALRNHVERWPGRMRREENRDG